MTEQPEQDTEAEQGPQVTGYQESGDHVPDPTALTGTLETSGTGGGVHERISGMTAIFGPVERDIVAVHDVVQKGAERIVERVEHVLHQEAPIEPQDAPPAVETPQETEQPEQPEPQESPESTSEETPAKKTAAKK